MVKAERESLRLPTGHPMGQGQRLRLGAEIVGAYLRAWRELRRVPIEQAVGRLRSGSAIEEHEGPEALEEAFRLGQAVSRTLTFLPGDTRCLRRSLVLTQLLARRGISGRLVIGARTAPDFLAHAWIEHEGVPVLSPEGDQFGRLVEL
jgi:hypothetical protein